MNYEPNIFLDMVSLTTMLTVLCFDFSKKQRGHERPMHFRDLLICVALILLLDMLAWRMNGRDFPGARTLLYVFNSLYYILQIVFCWLWVLFSCDWTGIARSPTRKPVFIMSMLPMFTEFALLITNPYTGWVFGIDTGNRYHRGSGYLFNLMPYVIYIAAALVITLYACFSRRDEEARRHGITLCIYMALPIFGSVMEAFNFGVPWTWPLTALSLQLMYMSIQEQQAGKARLNAARLEVELAESRRAIMLSQIQPHFLYNVLCVIQDLCHGKAPEAEEAVIVFSRFLRGNMDTLVTNGDIAFERELEHTRYYLTLEQMRFAGRLNVVYDIQCTLFRLPPLTLQPIVENAVRNGICKREQGGTITISTKETPEAYLVAVQDDGIGFDTNQPKEDGKSHIGVDNVRVRLRTQSGGTLSIESTPGVGTVAVITIPKRGDPA